jgi:hypothetical protein
MRTRKKDSLCWTRVVVVLVVHAIFMMIHKEGLLPKRSTPGDLLPQRLRRPKVAPLLAKLANGMNFA